MIPRIVTDDTITLMLGGVVHTINNDHHAFNRLKQLFADGCEDIETIQNVIDPWSKLNELGQGRVIGEVFTVRLDGRLLNMRWTVRLQDDPTLVTSLLARVGDTIRVVGDEDCPDGLYTVSGTENDDCDSRIYVETEDGFFGFIRNASVKEIVRAAVPQNDGSQPDRPDGRTAFHA